MNQLVAILVVLIVAAATYTAVTLLMSNSLSEPGVLPVVVGIAAGTIVGWVFYSKRRPNE